MSGFNGNLVFGFTSSGGSGGGGGTVTSVSVISGNGIDASVDNPTTTPNININNTKPDRTLYIDHLFINNTALVSNIGVMSFTVYNNGSSGVGATLRSIQGLQDNETTFTVNNITVSIGDSILVTNRTNSFENGLYYFSGTETNGDYADAILTRMPEYDQPSEYNNLIIVQINKTFPTTANLFVGSLTTVTTIGTSSITFMPIDNGMKYGLNVNRPLYPLVGQIYYQTDGVSGQYVYNGSTWQKNANSSVANFVVQHQSTAAYVDGTTYYFGAAAATAQTTQGIVRGIYNRTGIINNVYLFIRSSTTPSTESITLRLNNATGNGSLIQIASTTFSWSGISALAVVTWTGLNLSVNAGDTYEFTINVPSMIINPANVILSGNIELTYN